MCISKDIKSARGLDDGEVDIFRKAIVAGKDTSAAAQKTAVVVYAKAARNPYVVDFACELLKSPAQVYLLGCYVLPEDKDAAEKASQNAKDGKDSAAIVFIPAEDVKDEDLQLSVGTGAA